MFLRLRKKFQRLMQMTALRQAVILTTAFVFIVLIAGIIAAYLISHELDLSIDTELTTRHRESSHALSLSKFEPELFTQYSDRFEAYRRSNGEIIGDVPGDVFEAAGFSDFELDSDHENQNEEWRIYAAPATGGILVVGTSVDDRNEFLEITSGVFAITGILILGITLLGGLVFGIRTQRRISAISDKLKLVAEGDLSVRIGSTGARDDFDQLSLSIDATTQKLELLVRQLRDLTTNIAHDLKTPLTRLRGQLEKIEGQVNCTDNLDLALQQTDQIIATFEALLRIARLESGQHRSQFVNLDLGELAQEISDTYAAVIEDSGRSFHLKIATPHPISGDRLLLVQMIANLIENCIKHTPQGTRITLSVDKSRLTLVDTGPGIPADKHARVLEPMYRLETSRSTPGSGLGLALVKAIADLHHATLVLSGVLSGNLAGSSDKHGLAIEIEFDPLSQAFSLPKKKLRILPNC